MPRSSSASTAAYASGWASSASAGSAGSSRSRDGAVRPPAPSHRSRSRWRSPHLTVIAAYQGGGRHRCWRRRIFTVSGAAATRPTCAPNWWPCNPTWLRYSCGPSKEMRPSHSRGRRGAACAICGSSQAMTVPSPAPSFKLQKTNGRSPPVGGVARRARLPARRPHGGQVDLGRSPADRAAVALGPPLRGILSPSRRR